MKRTGFYTQLIAFQTLINQEVSRFMRIWSQTLLPPAITMTLYFIVFGQFIGAQLQPIKGFSYMQYIVPGLTMMAVMTNAYTNTAFSFFIIKFNKSIEEMIVSPMSAIVMLLGFTLGGIIRGLLTGIIVLVIARFFTAMPVMHWALTCFVAFLAAAIFSLGGLINAIYAKRFDDISFIPTFVLTPLTYLGGVFYSLQQLPPFWRSLSRFNPILDIIDGFRYGLLGIADISVVFASSLILVLFLILLVWAWLLIKTGKGTAS